MTRRAASGTTTGGSAEQVGGTLLYYNWADYVNPKTYPAFTKATTVKVAKDFYASNEDMLAKLKAGAKGYDLIVPTGQSIREDHGRRRPPAGARPVEAAECDGEHRPQVPGAPVRSRRQVVDPEGLGDDRVRLPDRSGQGAADDLEGVPRAGHGPVLEEGDRSRQRAGGHRLDGDDARLLVQHGRRGRAGRGQGRDARVEATPARDHFDGVPAAADFRPRRDGAWLERRRSGSDREEAGPVRDPRGGRRILDRRLLHPEGREEPRRRARVDQLLLRAKGQRDRDRIHVLRLAAQA